MTKNAKEPKDLETLRARLRTALMNGADTSAIRADIGVVESELRRVAEHRAAQEAKSAADQRANIQREVRARVEQSNCRLNAMLSTLTPN